ncbi:3-oxoacyl-[acyl-carrier protein] reductase [Lentibacillus persicus]|uniref:3-oxoacyl-[acyl-carrier protein] reductase n=1 Tax=Lentibacillus persicus TaxID=640948 RepID=A0A1I2ALE2_9BACI|nr:SDR family oxidoreductase [Lentibacillus persicus]SFE44537.1 3-oxoacyl-[acyl-carrier protein] reductase [Lentibacillus persicus]
MTFGNKTIVVAGAGGGMGKAIVETLLNENANVVGCDLNIASLEALEANDQFLGVEGNLLDEETVRTVFKQGKATFGRIDGLVNAAGVAQNSTPIEQVELKEWYKIIDINMTMTFLTCREAAVYMKEQGSGAIVNIGSVSVTRPRPGLQSYVASKGAVESFTKALALELADDRINVNILHPGPSDTNMLGQFAQEGADVEKMKATVFKDSVPLGRLIKPEDIARSVKFLLSEDAGMVTGSVFHVDGGRNI